MNLCLIWFLVFGAACFGPILISLPIMSVVHAKVRGMASGVVCVHVV
jgi:sugar phosphate permease